MADMGELLMSAARVLRRHHSDALRAWDLAPGQSRALRVIGELGTARLSVLAEHLHIAPRSATEVVDALQGRGLVVRGADSTDRRATTVSLTSAGLDLLAVVEQARRAASADFFSGVAAADRRELERILRRLAES